MKYTILIEADEKFEDKIIDGAYEIGNQVNVNADPFSVTLLKEKYGPILELAQLHNPFEDE